VRKVFGGTVALDEVDLVPVNGEFLTILGPSGCGKTTLLRLIAGLEVPSGGMILMNGQPVSTGEDGVLVLPEKRNLGMVFQSYAIWPHMTVEQNIAFPLRLLKRSRSEIRTRLDEVLELVSLTGLSDRLPSQLSGGQQQRVAMARAIAPEPDLLLLDEPLSNLDAKLRERTRRDLRLIQQKLGITTVMVTHDQTEAIELSDRIVVLSDGAVEQIGVPEHLYRRPSNSFVAGFLGAANLLPGRPDGQHWLLPSGGVIKMPEACPHDAATAVVRPEDVELLPGGVGATVISRIFSGAFVTYVLDTGDQEIVAMTRAEVAVEQGDDVSLSARHVHYLPHEPNGSAPTTEGES
jgi:iron(III) transport system ATP-binding protein